MDESASNAVEISTSVWTTIGTGWDWYWLATKACAIPGGFGIMSVIALYLLGTSLRLNYHYYIKHGQFVLYPEADSYEYKKKIREVSIDHKIGFEHALLPWFQAMIAVGVQAIVVFLCTLVWPIAVIVVLPLAVVRLIAFRKRRKTLFVQKLEGTAND